MQNSPFSRFSRISRISSSFTLSNRPSTTSSYCITERANAKSFFTKDSTASVTIFTVARAISWICSLLCVSCAPSVSMISAISPAWSPIRSISEIIFKAEEIVRKSLATGCCCKSRRMQKVSISRSMWSISLSFSKTICTTVRSYFIRAETEAVIASSHNAPILISSTFNCSSWASKRLRTIA